jgi:hypothetical protein
VKGEKALGYHTFWWNIMGHFHLSDPLYFILWRDLLSLGIDLHNIDIDFYVPHDDAV